VSTLDPIARSAIEALGLGSVGGNRLLAALPPADFSLLAAHFSETSLDPGTVLIEPGQPIKRVYFPHDGLIGMLGVLPDGHAILTATVGREGVIAPSAGLGADIAWSRAVVELPTRAAHISASRLTEVAAQNRAVRQMLVRATDALLGQLQHTLVCNTVHSVRQRLARVLLHARDSLQDNTVPFTQEFLAGILGVQRTTVTAMSRMLHEQHILKVRRGRIYILDRAALEREACECYGSIRRLATQASAPQRLPQPMAALRR
jgi:CRP-like cAMP-binding protein